MKRKLFYISIFIFFNFKLVIGQNTTTLEWVNPSRLGQSLARVAMPDTNHIYMLGGGGSIVKSTDRGLTWQETGIDSIYDGLNHLAFTDSVSGWLLSSHSGLYKTITGGKSWVRVSVPSQYKLTKYAAFSLIDSLHMFLMIDSGKLYYSNTGGKTWELRRVTGFTDFMNEYAAYIANFVDTLHCYLLSDNNVYRSSDGGKTWRCSPTTINNSVVRDQYNWLYFKDPAVGFIPANIGYYWKSLDSGISWKLYNNTSISQNLYNVYFEDQNTGYITGDVGRYLKTTDGGNSWSPHYTGMYLALIDIKFTNGFGILCGSYGNLALSRDHGKNWNRLNKQNGYTPVRTMHWFSRDTGLIAGLTWGIHYTADGGNTFKNLTPGLSDTFSYLSVFSKQLFYASTRFGYCYRTMDGWTTFKKYKIITTVPDKINNVHFLNPKDGIAFGDYQPDKNRRVYATSDSGKTWTTYYSGTSQILTSIFYASKDTCYLGGFGPILRVSYNGGKSYSNIPLSSDISTATYGMHWFDGKNGIITTEGSAYRTFDGGKNWKTILSNGLFNTVIKINGSNGVIVSDNNTINISCDSGKSWAKQRFHIDNWADCVYPINNICYFGSGWGGGIGRLTTYRGNLVGFTTRYALTGKTFTITGNNILLNGKNQKIYLRETYGTSKKIIYPDSIKLYNNKIIFAVPKYAPEGEFRVIRLDSFGITDSTYSYIIIYQVPVIDSFNQDTFRSSGICKIFGKQFGAYNPAYSKLTLFSKKLNESLVLSATSWTDTLIQLVVPESKNGPYYAIVQNDVTFFDTSDRFFVLQNKPQIVKLKPKKTTPFAAVKLEGTHFASGFGIVVIKHLTSGLEKTLTPDFWDDTNVVFLAPTYYNGLYSVKLRTSEGLWAFAKDTFELTGGWDLSNKNSAMSLENAVYPVPASSFIQIKGIELNANDLLEIFDINMNLVRKTIMTNQRIDVSNLNDGIYNLIVTRKDKQHYTVRFCIAKK